MVLSRVLAVAQGVAVTQGDDEGPPLRETAPLLVPFALSLAAEEGVRASVPLIVMLAEKELSLEVVCAALSEGGELCDGVPEEAVLPDGAALRVGADDFEGELENCCEGVSRADADACID